MVLMRDGSYLIPVCGFGKAKVDSSVFTVSKGGIIQKGNGVKIDFAAQQVFESYVCGFLVRQ